MPQVISRNTVLLQGGGRTNIEYSAGPNINITNDVISGRDWSNEIAKGGAAAVSAHLSAGDHIDLSTNDGITTISVTGDFYSAGPNIDITDNTISGKDWTNDIDEHIASAISSKADSSAIPEIVDYSAGDNINITDHVISGKDWSYEIGQKVDRSEFISGMSAVTERMVDTVSATSSEIIDIISATSGQGGGSCPWISGGKDYGSATVQLNFGDTIPVFSSWGLSADHNHYIWMKGAYVRLPDGSEFLPNSAFSSYTASMASNLSSNWEYTNSAYSMSLTNHYDKLENSAFSAYTAAHSADDVTPYSGGTGIDVTDHVISFTGEAGSNYSAGANIDITDNVISGKDWTGEISAASSILNQMIASGDNVAYSAGSNINITNHVVSGKDWTNEINAATSGKLDSSWTAGKDVTPYSAGSNINVTDHVISGKDWSTEIAAAGSGDKTPYSAGANINVTDHVISGKDWTDTIDEHIESAISGIEIPSAKAVSGASGIKIEETENSVIFSISGDVGKTYSAGANININSSNVISGRDWTTNINSATSGKLDSSWTAGKDVTPYSAGDNINVTNHVISGKNWSNDITAAIGTWSAGKDVTPYSAGSNINITDHVVSGKDWTNEIASSTSGKLDTSWTAGKDVTPYSAGSNINITNHVVSGKDWTDTILSAVSSHSGATYTSPSSTIIVDNDNSRLEASTSGILTVEHITAAELNQVSGTYRAPGSTSQAPFSGVIITDVAGGTSLQFGTYTNGYTATWTWGSQSGTYIWDGLYPVKTSSYGLTGTSATTNDLIVSARGAYQEISATAYRYTPGQTAYTTEKVDLWNNYSAGEGITINDHVISAAGKQYSGVAPVYVNNETNMIGVSAAWKLSAGDGVSFTVDEPTNTLTVNAEGGGDRNYYEVGTPATSYTAEGDLTFKYQASQSTPSRIYARIGSADVGLLAPTDVVSRGMLVTNYMGGVYWTAQSAIIPKDASAYAGYYTRTYTTADDVHRIAPGSGYPTMDHDWTFNVINQGSASIEYDMDGHGTTATLDPGYGIRLHYDVDDNYLDAEPEYPLGGDSYCTNYETMDGYKIRAVATSADIGNEWNIIYIVTGGNN